jgi:endonuclease-8
MPEGDSIRWLADKLRRAVRGKAVRAFEARTVAGEPDLIGRAIVEVDTHGKNLFVRFDDGRALHVHLRMTGRVRIEAPAVVHAREALRGRRRRDLRLEVDGAIVTGTAIPVLRLVTASAMRRTIAALGPDLLAPELDESDATSRLRALGARPIGEALMLQRAVSGIGNVYKSEVLFLERVHPAARVRDLDDATLARLLGRARELMQANVRAGRRRTRGARGAPGGKSAGGALAGPSLWVYGRAGQPCLACRGPIAVVRQGASPGRSTYFCPRCQLQSPMGCPAPTASSKRSARSSPGSPSGRSARARSSGPSTSRSR